MFNVQHLHSYYWFIQYRWIQFTWRGSWSRSPGSTHMIGFSHLITSFSCLQSGTPLQPDNTTVSILSSELESRICHEGIIFQIKWGIIVDIGGIQFVRRFIKYYISSKGEHCSDGQQDGAWYSIALVASMHLDILFSADIKTLHDIRQAKIDERLIRARLHTNNTVTLQLQPSITDCFHIRRIKPQRWYKEITHVVSSVFRANFWFSNWDSLVVESAQIPSHTLPFYVYRAAQSERF